MYHGVMLQLELQVEVDKIFWENGKTVTTNYTIGTGFGTDCNAGSWGPITINNGVTVTIPNNSNWTII